MKRGYQMVLTVILGEEVQCARQLWSQMRPAERETLSKLAAELVLLREGTSDSRVVVAPAEVLRQAGLPSA